MSGLKIICFKLAKCRLNELDLKNAIPQKSGMNNFVSVLTKWLAYS